MRSGRDAREDDDERAYRGAERRTRDEFDDEIEPVVLTRKLADAIDGISLSGRQVGDRLPLRPYEAGMLIAEGWAQATPPDQRRRTSDERVV